MSPRSLTLALLLAVASFPAAGRLSAEPPEAAGDVVRPRPWVHESPPASPTGAQKLDAWRYRDSLGAEIFRQERKVGPPDPRSLYPQQELRNERLQMDRSLRTP